MSLTEVIVASAVLMILFLGMAAFLVPYAKSRVLGTEKSRMHELMERVKERLVWQTRGEENWFNMQTMRWANGTDKWDGFAEFPGLLYHYDIGEIGAFSTPGVRRAHITVIRPDANNPSVNLQTLES